MQYKIVHLSSNLNYSCGFLQWSLAISSHMWFVASRETINFQKYFYRCMQFSRFDCNVSVEIWTIHCSTTREHRRRSNLRRDPQPQGSPSDVDLLISNHSNNQYFHESGYFIRNISLGVSPILPCGIVMSSILNWFGLFRPLLLPAT